MRRIHFIVALVLATLLPFTSTTAMAEGDDESSLSIYAEFDKAHPPGNIAIGPDGRKFLSIHEFYGHDLKLVELLNDGSVRPYPNKKWAYAPKNGGNGLHGVLGLNVDENGVLWLLDTSAADRAGRLIGWDTHNEKLVQLIYLAKPVITDSSFLNDLAVDNKNGFVYIADTAGNNQAAIIVVNLKTGQARRVLEGSRYTIAEDIDMVIDGRVIHLGGQPARLGINPITIDPQYKWVYFGAMSGTSIYRVKTKHLANFKLRGDKLEAKVKRYGDKPISDGITVDGGGNVYITSITDGTIGVTQPDGNYQVLFEDDNIIWPDGFAYGPDDKIYFTINQLHLSPVLNDGKDDSSDSYQIMSFDAQIPGKVGR